MRIIYGFDALCGWCFGMVPAMRAVAAAYPEVPITLAMPGLVTGARVGPYAEMEGYIRQASGRLQSVTARAPTQAFFDLIRRPDVQGDSGPPTAAIGQVASVAPDQAVPFAHAVIEAHFIDGADLNAVDTYRRLALSMGLDGVAFDLADTGTIATTQTAGQVYGITSFPTILVARSGAIEPLPGAYAPDVVVDLVGAALRPL